MLQLHAEAPQQLFRREKQQLALQSITYCHCSAVCVLPDSPSQATRGSVASALPRNSPFVAAFITSTLAPRPTPQLRSAPFHHIGQLPVFVRGCGEGLQLSTDPRLHGGDTRKLRCHRDATPFAQVPACHTNATYRPVTYTRTIQSSYGSQLTRMCGSDASRIHPSKPNPSMLPRCPCVLHHTHEGVTPTASDPPPPAAPHYARRSALQPSSHRLRPSRPVLPHGVGADQPLCHAAHRAVHPLPPHAVRRVLVLVQPLPVQSVVRVSRQYKAILEDQLPGGGAAARSCLSKSFGHLQW